MVNDKLENKIRIKISGKIINFRCSQQSDISFNNNPNYREFMTKMGFNGSDMVYLLQIYTEQYGVLEHYIKQEELYKLSKKNPKHSKIIRQNIVDLSVNLELSQDLETKIFSNFNRYIEVSN